MARIAILDRGDMNAEQARIYDAAKQSSGIVGGPYYAYIGLLLAQKGGTINRRERASALPFHPDLSAASLHVVGKLCTQRDRRAGASNSAYSIHLVTPPIYRRL
jgi:hypothetical protein